VSVATRTERQRTFRENHVKLEEAAFPQCLFLAWDTAAPLHEVETSLRGLRRLRIEAKGMILSPLLSVAVSYHPPPVRPNAYQTARKAVKLGLTAPPANG